MKTKRFLSIVLTLAMLLGIFPSMSLTASAADTTTTITQLNNRPKEDFGSIDLESF